MLEHFGISNEDWQQTSDSVQQAFSSLYHQLLLLEMRSEIYERQLAQLHEQVSQIKDLKTKLTELRERLGLNSNNDYCQLNGQWDRRYPTTNLFMPRLIGKLYLAKLKTSPSSHLGSAWL